MKIPQPLIRMFPVMPPRIGSRCRLITNCAALGGQVIKYVMLVTFNLLYCAKSCNYENFFILNQIQLFEIRSEPFLNS